MSDRIAVSVRKAAAMMLEEGMGDNAVVNTINGIKQPTLGYIYASDVINAINAYKRGLR